MRAYPEPPVSIAAFEAGDIDPAAFDHEAHVYAGWLYLREYPLADAIARYTAALKRLTEKLGIPEKYHETITWFFLLLIAERRAAANDDSWSSFRRANCDLFRKEDSILRRYYTDDVIRSSRARAAFMMPDRLAS